MHMCCANCSLYPLKSLRERSDIKITGYWFNPNIEPEDEYTRSATCDARSTTYRIDVAGLNGEPWLQFLDESYRGRDFTEGPGRLLPTLAYASFANVERIADEELDGLVRLVRQWIRRHRVRV